MNKVNSILLIDDNQYNNYINKNIIQDLGITSEIKIVHNGSEGIKYLQSCDHLCNYPDLILLDLIMPLVDGFQFMEYLQKMNFLQRKKPVILALTAVGDEQSIDRIRSLQVDDVLFKPLTSEKLLAAINTYFPDLSKGVKTNA